MYKENSKPDWDIEYKKNRYIGMELPPRIIPSDLEKAGDDLVWAIETVIESPMDIKCWFLVKDAIAKYKNVRRKAR